MWSVMIQGLACVCVNLNSVSTVLLLRGLCIDPCLKSFTVSGQLPRLLIKVLIEPSFLLCPSSQLFHYKRQKVVFCISREFRALAKLEYVKCSLDFFRYAGNASHIPQ